MSHSYTRILIHAVFCTKFRNQWLSDGYRSEMHSFIGETIESIGGKLIIAGSVEDHVHLLIVLPPTKPISELMMIIKKESSKWIKQKSGLTNFRWQTGYFAASVEYKRYSGLIRYIKNQRKHHQKTTSKQEWEKLTQTQGAALGMWRCSRHETPPQKKRPLPFGSRRITNNRAGSY